VIFFWHFYVNHYQVIKLKNWSLDTFANEMSDGFMLYDEYDDPIYMNDLLKNTFTRQEIEDFRNRDRLEEWLTQTVRIVNEDVREYVKSDGTKVYFRVKKNELGQ